MEMPEREVVLWGKVYASYSQVATASIRTKWECCTSGRCGGNELEDVEGGTQKNRLPFMGGLSKTLWIFALLTKSSQAMRMTSCLRYGMSLEEAVTRPVKEVKHGEPEYRGKPIPARLPYAGNMDCPPIVSMSS